MKESLKLALEKYKINKTTLLFIAGLVGILLIALAPKLSFGSNSNNAKTSTTQEQSAEAYAATLEQRLTSILGDVEGVGKVRVMVTLKGGYGYDYAKQEKTNNDRMEDSKSADDKKTQEKSVTEETYILVDGPGGKVPLITEQREPEIKGVVVVCSGGGDPRVVIRVVDTVKVALNISSGMISVSQLSA